MSIVVLGATGGTGRQIVSRALTDGHEVRALARTPDTANLPTHPRLQVVRADVHDHDSITAAIGSDDIVLSGFTPLIEIAAMRQAQAELRLFAN